MTFWWISQVYDEKWWSSTCSGMTRVFHWIVVGVVVINFKWYEALVLHRLIQLFSVSTVMTKNRRKTNESVMNEVLNAKCNSNIDSFHTQFVRTTLLKKMVIIIDVIIRLTWLVIQRDSLWFQSTPSIHIGASSIPFRWTEKDFFRSLHWHTIAVDCSWMKKRWRRRGEKINRKSSKFDLELAQRTLLMPHNGHLLRTKIASQAIRLGDAMLTTMWVKEAKKKEKFLLFSSAKWRANTQRKFS